MNRDDATMPKPCVPPPCDLPALPRLPDLRTKPGLLAAKAKVGARTAHTDQSTKANRRTKGKQAKVARRRNR